MNIAATTYLAETFGMTIAEMDPMTAQVVIEGAEQGDELDRQVRDAYFAHHHMKQMSSSQFAETSLYRKCLTGMGLAEQAA